MREWVYDCWNHVMNSEVNPLRHIPDLSTRHMIMQVLAWMWCIAFAIIVGSYTVFAISAIAHVVLIGAIVVTVGTFKVAEYKPQAFDFIKGYHTPSRGRSVYVDGKRIELPEGDAGGEHD